MTTKEKYKELGLKYSFYTVFFKRFIDIILSFIAIVVLSPFYILFALLTLIFNGYPIIYKQARPGKNHKVFFIYKFRSMTNKKDKDGNLLPDNQRITFWGKIIRKTSIDELPQFFNILKGDMSFIGIRPKLVKDVIFYEKDVYDQYIARPGITGYAAAYGRNRNTWESTFEKDRYYLQNVSLWLDIKIIFKTIATVFTNRGESHSNSEEDKANEKEQEYYYADYLLRTEVISKEQYDLGINKSNEIIGNKGVLEFYSEMRNKEEFEKIYGKKEEQKEEIKKEKTSKTAKKTSTKKTETKVKEKINKTKTKSSK